jgi:hypothetical protein
LKRSLAVTKNKARELGTPFQSEADLRTKRRLIFKNSLDAPRASALVRISED